jgi:hypothetical protein
MGKTGVTGGKKLFPVIALVAAAALSGCHGSTPAAAGGTATSARATVTGTGPAGCNGNYCQPPDWDTAKASTPLTQIAPFSEPLNVVISARSTVSLARLQQALGTWKTVSTASSVTITGIRLKCISSETADVTGNGYLPQHVAWRLGGCIGGNDLSLSGEEDHVRIWNQPVPGSTYGAWFIAASYETMCLVKNGQLVTAASDEGYAALHPGAAYHCVDGGPGSITARHSDGYTDAGRDFAAAVVAAARGQGWQVSEQTVSVPRRAAAGEGGVPFGPAVYVLTLTG